MGGRALTATELAFLARISRSTASEHLAKLVGARLISVTRKRRFSYYRITSPLVARMLESIKVIAAIEAPPRYQARSAQDAALRLARTCYDHLAGYLGVAIADTLSARGLIVLTDDGGIVTPEGEDFFRAFGVPLKHLQGQRIFCRPCLDWSERRFHVAGLVGAQLLRAYLDRDWLAPQQDTRAMLITPAGQKEFAATFGVTGLCAQPLAVGFIERMLHTTITWLEWFVAAAPFAVLMSVALYFVMTRMMLPEVAAVPGGREAIRKSLTDLGPMKAAEKKLLAISLALLAFWATEGVLHRLDTSTTTVTAVALMFLPGLVIMTWKEAQPKIPWGTVVLFGIGISLGTALLQTKGATWLADIVVAQFGLRNATTLFILGVMSLFLVVIHLGFASATALAAAMIPIVIAVLQGVATPGIKVIGMTMLLQFVVSFGFILVVNAPQNMVAYGTETFEARDFVRTGVVLTVIALALVMVLGATYWRWLGYV